jgi:Haem-binding domain
MKKILRYTALFLLGALIVIQFFRPKKNKQEGEAVNHISKAYAIPDDVNTILKKACYDCHSNNTRYPWYANIQPVGWWLADHIKGAKKELNFSEFASYNQRRQYRKMEEVVDEVKEGGMPLNSYTWIHKDARLTDDEKNKVIGWADSIRDTLKARYPIDSLIRKK